MSERTFTWDGGAFRSAPLGAPPEPRAGHAIVRPRRVGLCGSDLLHVLEGPQPGQCFGHEWLGLVAAVAADVTTLRAGDAVTSSPFIGCGGCPACLAERTNHCRQATILGAGPTGALRTWLELPAAQLVPVPAELEPAGILLEPASVAVEAVRLLDGLDVAGPVAIVGGGPIGLLTACRLGDRGDEVVVFERHAHRRELAARLGLKASDAAAAHHGHFAALIDCSSALVGPGGFALALELGRRGAGVVCVAKYPRGRTLDGDALARGAFTVAWMRGAPLPALHAAVAWGDALTRRMDLLVTDVLPAERVGEALERGLAARPAGKLVLELGG